MLQNNKKVEYITPPNFLKQKVGSGGLPMAVLEKAQRVVESTHVDIIPQAKILLIHIRKGIDTAKADYNAGYGYTERARNEMTYPTMQLKANGRMFHYPLITEIASRLLHFLETLDQINEDSLKMIEVHYKTLQLVIKVRMQQDREGIAQQFMEELESAQDRYKKRYDNRHANDDDKNADVWYIN